MLPYSKFHSSHPDLVPLLTDSCCIQFCRRNSHVIHHERDHPHLPLAPSSFSTLPLNADQLRVLALNLRTASQRERFVDGPQLGLSIAIGAISTTDSESLQRSVQGVARSQQSIRRHGPAIALADVDSMDAWTPRPKRISAARAAAAVAAAFSDDDDDGDDADAEDDDFDAMDIKVEITSGEDEEHILDTSSSSSPPERSLEQSPTRDSTPGSSFLPSDPRTPVDLIQSKRFTLPADFAPSPTYSPESASGRGSSPEQALKVQHQPTFSTPMFSSPVESFQADIESYLRTIEPLSPFRPGAMDRDGVAFGDTPWPEDQDYSSAYDAPLSGYYDPSTPAIASWGSFPDFTPHELTTGDF